MSQPKKPVVIVNPATGAKAAQPATSWVVKPTEPIEKFYKLGQRLGQPGQFGQAVLATHLKTGATRAVKVISKGRFSRTADIKYHFEQLRAEIEVMQKMNHPNIIKLYEVFESPSDLYLVMECCTGGELFDRIKDQGAYSEKDASNVLRQMCEGIKYMHESGVAHCFPASDTRILTDRGFFYLSELRASLADADGAPIRYAAFDLKSRSIVYCDGEIVQIDQNPANLIEFSSSEISLRSTENHRMLARSAAAAPAEWVKSRADQFLTKSEIPEQNQFEFLTHAEAGVSRVSSSFPLADRLGLSCEAEISALIQFYGFFVSCGLSYRGEIRFILRAQQLADQFITILNSLGLSSSDWSLSADSENFVFAVTSPLLVAEFLYDATEFDSASLYSPALLKSNSIQSWVLQSLTTTQIRSFLATIQLATGSNQFILTDSQSICDSLLVLILHAGFTGEFQLESNIFTIQYTSTPSSASLSRSSSVSRVSYSSQIDGELWCVNVDHPDHLIIAQKAVRSDSTVAGSRITQAFRPVVVGNCDLKPDNFLFLSPLPTSPIKIIDFGMSKFLRSEGGRSKYFSIICGTPYYVAPEVIQGKYSEDCDLWSLGVVMFVMLFGYPCFYCDEERYGGETDDRIFQLIQQGFQPVTKAGFGAHFPASIPCSESAKDLIAKLLQSNPTSRISAAEALEHPWLTGHSASDKPILQNVLTNLKNFHASCKFKAAVLNMMSSSLSEDEIQTLRKTFQDIDENGDGTITKTELKKALEKAGSEVKTEELEAILRMADVDGDGTISFEELLMTCVQKKLNAKEERIYEAFCKLDLNGDGKLSVEELEKVLTQNAQDAKALIAEVDIDGDGTVSYEEFITMWRGKEEAAQKSGTNNSLTQKVDAATAQLK